MRIPIPAFAALMVVSAVPGLAAEHATSASPHLRIASNDDFASQKSEYEARARREMDLWQQRMSEASARTQGTLDQAWKATKEHWADLQQATADGWDRSRTAFEQASERMKEEWHKFHPNEQ